MALATAIITSQVAIEIDLFLSGFQIQIRPRVCCPEEGKWGLSRLSLFCSIKQIDAALLDNLTLTAGLSQVRANDNPANRRGRMSHCISQENELRCGPALHGGIPVGMHGCWTESPIDKINWS